MGRSYGASSKDFYPARFQSRRQRVVRRVAASQPDQRKAIGQARRDEILRLNDQRHAARFRECCAVGRRAELHLADVLCLFPARLQPPAKRRWKSRLDEEGHSAARTIG